MYICSVNLPLFCPYKRIRIPRDFCLWNAESGKFLLVGSEILGFGIQNPEFHEWLGSEILVPPTKNSVFSTCISRIHSVSAKTVLDSSGGSRRGALGPSHPLIFRPNWGPKGRKKVLRDRSPLFSGSGWLSSSPLIWRSESATVFPHIQWDDLFIDEK